MVSLTIDGQSVSVPAGTSVMAAAASAGTQIPKLCATDMLEAFERNRDVAHLGQRVEIEDANMPGRARPGNVKIATVRVGSHVVESTIAADQLNFENLIRATRLSRCEAYKRQHYSDGCDGERLR